MPRYDKKNDIFKQSFQTQLSKFLVDSNQVKVPGLFNLEEVLIPRKPDVYSAKNSSIILNDKLSSQRLNSEVTRNQQYRTESFKNMNISILKPLINERPFTFNNNQDNSKEQNISVEIVSDIERLETQTGDQMSVVQKELQLSIIKEDKSAEKVAEWSKEFAEYVNNGGKQTKILLIHSLNNKQQGQQPKSIDANTKRNKRRRQDEARQSVVVVDQQDTQRQQTPINKIWRNSSILFCQSLKLEPNFLQQTSRHKKLGQYRMRSINIRNKKSMSKRKQYSLDNSQENQNNIQYTQIDPVTDKKLVGISKRIDFNRKFERSDLNLLIIKYDGVIGIFDKEDVISENQSLIIRPGLSKLLKILHSRFQIVIYIEQKSQEKYEIIKQHSRTYKSGVKAKEIFFDGIYKSYNKNRISNYSQILLDFEVPRERDNVFILEPLHLTDIDRDSFEVQSIIDRQIDSELEITRIFLPHIQIFNDYRNNNICLKVIAEYIQSLFQENDENEIVMRDTAELKAMCIKNRMSFIPHEQLPEYICLTNEERPIMDVGTYNRLLMQNAYIQQQVTFHKTKYDNRKGNRDSQLDLIKTLNKQKIYEKQIIYLSYQDSEQFQKFYTMGNKLQLDVFATVQRQKEECDILREIIRRKIRRYE